ncbi:MAG TPA: hypothetical protein VLI05_02025 [Candidatus Saccharimonadia bacterium]|nr:hypothetical protein [Candidatus Saccharimonadia bacterium]
MTRYDLGPMLTADEEAGSANGTEWLAAQGYHKTSRARSVYTKMPIARGPKRPLTSASGRI